MRGRGDARLGARARGRLRYARSSALKARSASHAQLGVRLSARLSGIIWRNFRLDAACARAGIPYPASRNSLWPGPHERKLAMPNIGTIFKQEISRLSRKEIRRETQGLRRAATQQRRAIALLKREASKLQSEVARLERQVGGIASPPVSDGEADGVRFTAKGVHTNRARLGISAADFGKLIGVSAQTIYKWEHGSARPRKRQLAVLASLRRVGKKEAVARLQKLGSKSGNGSRRGR